MPFVIAFLVMVIGLILAFVQNEKIAKVGQIAFGYGLLVVLLRLGAVELGWLFNR